MSEWYKMPGTCPSSESPGGDSGLSLSAYLAFGHDTSRHTQSISNIVFKAATQIQPLSDQPVSADPGAPNIDTISGIFGKFDTVISMTVVQLQTATKVDLSALSPMRLYSAICGDFVPKLTTFIVKNVVRYVRSGLGFLVDGLLFFVLVLLLCILTPIALLLCGIGLLVHFGVLV
ncbi:hypothetical protein EV363DRAFT_1326309 [Boletus edulis]|nr:hypothetical protein EV363DRAFT_1326309 [Boletus edulis]